ncbi:hypothetical protein PV327_007168 [Microctonus hyperodae]|uniref:Fanconi anemia group M protein n=1 Tax=Microctonus hyperodae TaxID=165561 RepID=A0AA39KJ72_MICHY|nr:hypothetical protein PV327_007168 [Microctonus hyperodae]
MDLLSQQPLYSTEPETKGFDLSSGNKWIYPENYPIREYQFTIVKTALFHNTLVCLPTGLGKTFIAAVVMYNFWRWYPSGIIVFLAPTKPLVAQQIEACHDIMGIPISQTIELTGAINQKQREIAWRNKRVIFATPQTFQNDIEKGIVKTELIKCVVIDEAHKALGKHSYSESIRLLRESNRYYRLLALSATPGSKLDAVQDVIRNLHITHLELRDDTSPDITPYINERKLEIIPVGLGDDLTRFHERYIVIMDPHFRVLLKNNILRGATSNISKGRLFLLRKEFMCRQNKPYNYGSIMKTLNILLTMCHANDLLINHGLRAFVHFYQNHADKFWLKDEPDLSALLNEINEFIGPFPDIKSLTNDDDDTCNIPDNIVFGHEKFYKLRELLITHFKSSEAKNADTRAIVFIEFRDIVNEVFILLLQLRPLIRPQVFVGQAGLKQKQQKKALDDFRNNYVNVLISTSVGEEGLDVGEVDLIVCFDILQHSPTRLVQRMGRTGRKRDGHIIVLVTDGREYKTLKSALAKRDSLNNKVLHSSGIIDALGEVSPRMIPAELNPECLKMRITVIPTTPGSRKMRKNVGTKVKKSRIIKDNEKKVKNVLNPISGDKNTNSSKTTQSAMMKFLIAGSNHDNVTQDNDVIDMRIEEVHPVQFQSQLHRNNLIRIKPSDVKLLSSDNQSIEFLTLCALKQSKKDINTEKTLLNMGKISYIPEYSFDNSDPFCNIEIPPLSILDCIKTLDEYIPSTVDDYVEIENDEIWEHDHFSNYADNSRCPELILTNGRFEDILDDISDSDETVFSVDESFTHEPVDWGNNEQAEDDVIQENNDDTINKKNLMNSIVIGGAFEDILDESSDESVLEPPKISSHAPETNNYLLKNEITTNCIDLISEEKDEVPIISLISPECKDEENDPNNLHENVLSNCSVKNSLDKEEKIEEKNKVCSMDFDLNMSMDFQSDSWDNDSTQIHIKSTKISNSNPIKSQNNEEMSLPSEDLIIDNKKSQEMRRIDEEEVNNAMNNSPNSPELIKSTQRYTNMKLNTTQEHLLISESAKENANEANCSDDDMFGVESLLIDSDFEDQLSAVEDMNIINKATENTNIINENIHEDKTHECIDKITVEQTDKVKIVNNEKKSIDDLKPKLSKPNSVSDNEFVDDFEWNSDFEILSAPLNKSKYFQSNSNKTSKPSSSPNEPPSNIPENSTKPPTEINKENNILQPKANNKFNIHQKFISKIRSKFQENLDSDDDFTSTKIEEGRVFRKLENTFSDDDEFTSDPSRSVADNKFGHSSNRSAPKSTSIKHFDKFVALKNFSSKSKVDTATKPSWIETRKSSSLDSFPRKKPCRRNQDKVKCVFINDEAEVSSDGTESLGTSGDDTECDDELASFVSHSQYNDTAVDMRAHYLQSLRSPRQPGRFLIKKPKTPPPNIEIYSQPIPDEPNTYLYDSFCVRGDSDATEYSDHSLREVSILTEVERKLKRKKRKRKNSSESSQAKRKRIVINVSDDTSEDETEKLRAEIVVQSKILKK